MLVYAPSYQSVFLIGWLLSRGYDVTVLTGHPNLILLLKEWGIPVVELPAKVICSIKHPVKTLQQRNSLKRTLTNFDDADLFFAFNAYDVRGFFVVQEWLKMKRKVFWIDLDPARPKWGFSFENLRNKEYRKMLRTCIKIRALLNTKVQIVGKSTPVVGVTQSFLSSLGVTLIEEDEKVIREAAVGYLPTYDASVEILVATEGPFAYEKCFDYGAYWATIENLIAKYKGKVGIKFHPALIEKPTSITSMYPAFYPVELLINKTPFVIGIYSTALIAAALNTHITVISLLELIPWLSNDLKVDAMNFLFSDSIAKQRIKFPTTIEELYVLLGDIV